MNESCSPKINVDVGASAKLEVKTEIPPEASGNALNALVDVFRPFTEARGLKADQIRLQREDVLFEIAKKARERLAIENGEHHPLPNKFLIPFMEKASLENIGSELIDRWADLLAGGSSEPNKAHPRFVQILSELTSNEVNVLRQLALHAHNKNNNGYSEFYDNPLNFEPKILKDQINKWLEEFPTDVEHHLNQDHYLRELIVSLLEYLLKVFCSPSVSLSCGYIENVSPDYDDINERYPPFDDACFEAISANAKAVNILESFDLLKQEQVIVKLPTLGNKYLDNIHLELDYIRLTFLGTEFIEACDKEAINILKGTKK